MVLAYWRYEVLINLNVHLKRTVALIWYWKMHSTSWVPYKNLMHKQQHIVGFSPLYFIKMDLHLCICFSFSFFLTVKKWLLQILHFQIPSVDIQQYTSQVLGVILALLEDPDESVQLTAVSCLLMVNSLHCVCVS